MIRLLNERDKTYAFQMTDHPISNLQESPEPTGKPITNDMTEAEEKAIKEHPNYSKNQTVELKAKGVTEFKNDEHAEYIFKILGDPEDGGSIPSGAGKIPVTNKNFVHEVDEKGIKIMDNLYAKYRIVKTAQMSEHVRVPQADSTEK